MRNKRKSYFSEERKFGKNMNSVSHYRKQFQIQVLQLTSRHLLGLKNPVIKKIRPKNNKAQEPLSPE